MVVVRPSLVLIIAIGFQKLEQVGGHQGRSFGGRHSQVCRAEQSKKKKETLNLYKGGDGDGDGTDRQTDRQRSRLSREAPN